MTARREPNLPMKISLTRRELSFAFALALGAVVITILSTSTYGPGMSTDSTNYLAGALHIQQGQGFMGCTGDPILWWPPLYSWILAVIGAFFKLDILQAGRIINSLAYGMTIVATAILAARVFPEKRYWVYVITSLVAFSYSMLLVAANLITEPLFILLFLIWVLIVQDYLQTSSIKKFWLATALAALAPLLRYIGVEFIIAGALIIFWKHKRSFRQAVIRAGLYGALSSLPIGYWVLYRNYFRNGSFTGVREFEQFKVLPNLLMSLDRMLHWFIPRQVSEVIPTGMILILVVAIVLISSSRKSRGAWVSRLVSNSSLSPLWLVAGIHFILIVLTTYTDDHFWLYDDRFQLPLYVPLLVGLGISFEEVIAGRFDERAKKRLLQGFAVLLLLWFVFPINRIQKFVRGSMQQGVLYYNTYNHVDLLGTEFPQYLRSFGFPENSIIYTNHISQLYFLIETDVEISPRDLVNPEPTLAYLQQEYSGWGQGDFVYLVWFTPTTRRNYYQDYFRPDQLDEIAELIPLREFPGGILYQVETDLSSTSGSY